MPDDGSAPSLNEWVSKTLLQMVQGQKEGRTVDAAKLDEMCLAAGMVNLATIMASGKPDRLEVQEAMKTIASYKGAAKRTGAGKAADPGDDAAAKAFEERLREAAQGKD
jgi:hypothetical protein